MIARGARAVASTRSDRPPAALAPVGDKLLAEGGVLKKQVVTVGEGALELSEQGDD